MAKKHLVLVVGVLLLFSLIGACYASTSAVSLTSMTAENRINFLNQQIEAKNLSWTAAENALSHLSKEERLTRLGQNPPDISESRNAETLTTSGSSSFPALDWRNNGGNWVSSVKNQTSCGSCWAFAAVGVAESRAKLDLNNPGYNIDLSEQNLVSCDTNSYGCSGGWSSTALDYMQNTGIVKEACFPYSASDESCSNICTNWQNGTLTLQGYGWIYPTSPSAIKQAINDYGPITVYMAVFDDFFDYSSGIYSYAYGDLAGFHAISIVGYNDTGNYWICKNSWGFGWGESGYFKLAYSENVLNYGDWYTAANCNTNLGYLVCDGGHGSFFLDDSYYIAHTDITSAPTINNIQANVTIAGKDTPINFTANVIATSIKTLTNVTLGNQAMSGNLTTGGLFSKATTPTALGCINMEGTCYAPINATDDANTGSIVQATVTVDNLAPQCPTGFSTSAMYNMSFQSGITCSDMSPFLVYFESNFTGAMQNYSVDGPSFTFTIGGGNNTPVGKFIVWRWWVNDSFGNIASPYGSNYTVMKATSHVTLNMDGHLDQNATTTYGFQSNVSATTDAGSVTLYQDGNPVANPNVATLSVGYYNYTAVSSGDGNYSASSKTLFLTVDKAAPIIELKLNDADSDVTLPVGGGSVNISAALVTPASGSLNLTQDSVSINSGPSPLANTSNFTSSGSYTITASYAGNSNYTSGSKSHTVTVQSQQHNDNSGSTGSGGGSGGITLLGNITLTNNVPKELDLSIGGGSYGLNFLGESHTIRLSGIIGDSAELTISSTPIKILLKAGETKSIDANGNGQNDLQLTLLSMTSTSANIAVKLIETATEKPLSGAAENATAKGNANATKESSDSVTGAFLGGKVSKQGLTLIAVLIAVALITLLVTNRMFKGKRANPQGV